jgi:hypothetical protein
VHHARQLGLSHPHRAQHARPRRLLRHVLHPTVRRWRDRSQRPATAAGRLGATTATTSSCARPRLRGHSPGVTCCTSRLSMRHARARSSKRGSAS